MKTIEVMVAVRPNWDIPLDTLTTEALEPVMVTDGHGRQLEGMITKLYRAGPDRLHVILSGADSFQPLGTEVVYYMDAKAVIRSGVVTITKIEKLGF